ncbi:hypothetical protein HWV62_45202 [Athelia sp. TMB]|nr:hypothetical protein HWV62_45202 [Athelia sp. TMB]
MPLPPLSEYFPPDDEMYDVFNMTQIKNYLNLSFVAAVSDNLSYMLVTIGQHFYYASTYPTLSAGCMLMNMANNPASPWYYYLPGCSYGFNGRDDFWSLWFPFGLVEVVILSLTLKKLWSYGERNRTMMMNLRGLVFDDPEFTIHLSKGNVAVQTMQFEMRALRTFSGSAS